MNNLSSRAIAFACLAIAQLPVQAQIIPDNTLGPENSQVSPTQSLDGTAYYRIDRGATRGPNLFHSFSNFELQSGEAAYFTPPAGVERIFSRVTSQTPSQIDGILGVQGSNADLFLLNPRGIVFGPNARLDLGGSFIGSSAEAILFHDGTTFNAILPQASTPLTVSVPLGLQLGQQAGAIQIQGTGHRLRAVNDPYLSPYISDGPPSGLQISPQQTLALLGGDLLLQGGSIQAPGGRVELGSVSQSGLVQLQPNAQGWSLGYPQLNQFGTLQLIEQASIEVGGGPMPGHLYIQAGVIDLQDASIIRNVNLSPEMGGTISINAHESLSLSGGPTSNLNLATAIIQDQLGPGGAGSVKIRSAKVAVQAGAVLANRNYGFYQGSRLQLDVDQLRVEGFAEQRPDAFSRIATVSLSSGQGGAMQVDAQDIDVSMGGFLGSVTLLEGEQGGDVWINSDRITIQGLSPANINSLLGANHLGRSGRSGNLNISTRILEIWDGGLVSTSSVAAGDAGNLTVDVKESITLRSSSDFQSIPSGIGSSVFSATPILQQLFGLPAVASGAGGNVFVQTPDLLVEQGAQITVDNSGIGRAGSLKINAENIRLQDQGSVDAFTLAGDGGNIQIQSQQLILLNESGIFAVALGNNNAGNGGNITIDSSIILGANNSDILARAQQGKGGNINITAETLLGLESRPQVSSKNDINASSDLGLDGVVQVNLLTVNPISKLNLPKAELIDASQLIGLGCGELEQEQFVISGKGGVANDPTALLASPIFWRDTPPTLESKTTPSPTIQPAPQLSQSFQRQLIQEAVAWTQTRGGEVQLLGTHPKAPLSSQSSGCLSQNL